MDNEELRVRALELAHVLRPDVINPEPKIELAKRLFTWFHTGKDLEAITADIADLHRNGWRIVRFDPTTVEQGPLIITDEWKPQ